jgi:Flp pilus assembly protein TadD
MVRGLNGQLRPAVERLLKISKNGNDRELIDEAMRLARGSDDLSTAGSLFEKERLAATAE